MKKSISLPRNLIFAKAYPAADDVRTIVNVDTPAKTKEFRKKRRKGQRVRQGRQLCPCPSRTQTGPLLGKSNQS